MNRFYLTPITHRRWIKAMSRMIFHDKATCFDTTRITDWVRLANNAVKSWTSSSRQSPGKRWCSGSICRASRTAAE